MVFALVKNRAHNSSNFANIAKISNHVSSNIKKKKRKEEEEEARRSFS